MRILMITIQSEKEKKIIVFDDMIADILTNKIFQAIIKELFIRCRNQIFPFFYYSISFFCFKRCQIKYNTLFHHENKQNNRIKKYCD